MPHPNQGRSLRNTAVLDDRMVGNQRPAVESKRQPFLSASAAARE
jgi:hypothetical protein